MANFIIDENNNITRAGSKSSKAKATFSIDANGNIKRNKVQNKKQKSGLFQKSKYFDDGYDAGDITKTIFWSGADLLQDVSKGFTRTIEGTVDTLGYAGADVLDFLGADESADWLRDVSKYDITNNILKESDYLESRSVFGNFSDTVFEGVGNVGAMILTSNITGGGTASSVFSSFSSAYGNSMSEALRNGQDLSTARKSALINGTAEAISEQFFDALPGMKVEGWGSKTVGKLGTLVEKYFGTNTGKIAMKILNNSGEGFEEIISNMLVSVGNDIMHKIDKDFTYGMENQTGNIGKDIWKSLTSKESWAAFFSASLTSALTNGGNRFISNTQKNKLIKSYAQENNMTVSEVKQAFDKSVQAKSQVELMKNPNMNLGQKVDVENLAKAQTVSELKRGTFVEPGTETELYKYKKSNNEDVNKMHESLVNVNANNSQLNKEAARTAERLIKDLGFKIEFTNNQQIEQGMTENQKQNLKGRDINGFVKDGTMYLNIDSNELANFTIGHEAKHFFEANEELNNMLNESLKEYAQEKGIWDTRLKKVTDLYTDENGNLVGNPEAELLADLTGEVFTNYDFVNNLSLKNPSLFEKVRDFFQKMYYKATGQKEKLLLKNINDNLNKVYREFSKNKYDKSSSKNGETKFLLSYADTAKINGKQSERIAEAVEMKEKNETDENIWEKTGVLFDGDLTKFYVKDLKSKIDDINYFKNNLNVEMKFEDLFDSSIFENYPQLKKYDFEMKNFEQEAINQKISQEEIEKLKKIKASAYDKGIVANNTINSIEELEKVLSHEAQHLIQEINGDKTDSYNVLKEQGKKAYRTLPSELEAETNRVLNSMNKYQKRNINPESIREELLKYYEETNYNRAADVDKIINRLINKHGIHYSLSESGKNTNSDGKKITKEQEEYFKDTKVLDSEGNLQIVYHGTVNPGFTIFKPSEGTSVFGKYKFNDYDVNYFTASKDTARGYTAIGVEEMVTSPITGEQVSNIYEAYLNITNPYVVQNTSEGTIKSWRNIKDNNIREYETKYYERFEKKWNNNKKISDNLEQINADLFPFNCELRFNDGYYELYNFGKNDGYGEQYLMYVNGDDTVSELFNEGLKENIYGTSFSDYYYTSDEIAKWVIMQNKDGKKYDGIIIPNIVDTGTKGSMFGEPTTDYITFNSNQIKDTHNLKPTTDSDIRYSLSQELDDYLDKNKFILDVNGNMSFENLTSKQITALASIYRKTGYSDVSSEYLKNKLSTFNGLKVPREVTDKFIQQELGYKPKIDTNKVYEDAEGNPLTKEQVEFYKDSDVRDIRGRLIPVYHRTNADFTVFDNKAGKQHGNKYGKGFYFSITPENYGNNEMKVYLNAKEGEYKYIPSQGYYVVQEPNQIKNVDNTNPTDNPDIRYSLSQNEDTYLDELSEQQMEYFKNTKAVDKQGYLDVVFHGTPKDFTVFDISQADNVALGNGLYFTTSEGNAKSYAKGTDGTEGKVLEGYVNIVNPASRTEKTLTFDNFKKLYNELNNNAEMYDEEMGMSNINALLSDYGNVYEENIDNILRKFYDSYDNDVSLIDNLSYIDNAKEMYKTLRNVTGLDGIIVENPTGFDDKETYYIIFNPEQFKLKSNKTPTINEDMRYSISQEGEVQSDEYKDLFPGMTRSTVRLSDLKKKEVELPKKEKIAVKSPKKEQKTSEKPTRREVIDRNRQLAREQLGDITGIKDKKRGLLYQINTMKRNLRDIMSKEQAQSMYDTYFKDITTNNARIENEITSYNERIQKYNLNDAESTYTQMLGELKHNPETTLTKEDVENYYYKNANKIDQQKCEQAVEEFRNIYDELIVKINDVLTDNGYKPIEYRKGYFPHFIEDKATSKLGKLAEKLGWKVKKGQLPTDIAGITDQFKPGKVWTSFAQQRTGDATDYNALKGLDNYLRGAMDVIYHTNDIQKLRALENEIRYQYSSKGIQEKINDIYADNSLDMEEKNDAIANLTSNIRESGLGNFVTEIRNYTDNLANKKSITDRGLEQTFGRDVYSIMNNINGRVSANMVGANISSAITNFIPITQAWGNISTKNLLRGMYDTIKTSIKNDNFADRSVFLTNRTKQADRLYNTKLDKINKKLGIPFEAIDSFTANTIVRSKYYDNIAKGMSEQQAISNADEFAKDVMAGRSKGDQPTMFNKKNPLVKLFTAFQLEVNNQYGYMFKDIPTNLADEAKDKLIGAFIKMFLGAWLYNEITEKFTGRRAAFDPIDMAVTDIKTLSDENMDLGDKIQSIVKDTSQELPFISGVTGGGRLPIQGAIPYSSPLEMITSTFEDIGNLDDPDKRKTAINNLKKEWSKPVYYLAFPFAGGQIKKTIEGLSMYDKDLPVAGSYTSSGKLRFEADTSTLGKIQSAVFGQYASKNAREYFDKGYTPLTENQLEEALDAELPINEYRKINQGIKEAKAEAKAVGGSQSEAMYDYIYDLPISMEQKNSLINSKTKGSNTVKDKNGYIKYEDEKGKTYWYDSKNDTLYNSKYRVINNKDVNDMTKVSTKKDLSNYGDYGSLEEFNYSNNNPDKYLALTQITDYDTYNEYKDEISAIKQSYDSQSTEARKKAVFNYINSLPLNIEQKLMLQKMAGGYSIKRYKKRMQQYINSLNLTKAEKESIDKVLFK